MLNINITAKEGHEKTCIPLRKLLIYNETWINKHIKINK